MPTGLTQKAAEYRLKKTGLNELPAAKRKKLLGILLEIVKEPMISLLLFAGFLYLLLGDRLEAFLLLMSIFGVVGISLYEESKTEKSLHALSELSSPRAVVIRDGKEKRISGREVVPGDLVILVEGDRVPADVRLLEAVNLCIDESHLTGESKPVDKNITSNSKAFSGSMVVRGHGLAEVAATGLDTEIGKIGKSLKSIEIEKTLLQKEVASLVKWLAILGLGLCVVLAAYYALTRHNLIHGILAGLTLAISILPEEFPIVLLLFMVVGAWRLAKSNVLTRRAPTIETLGAATVLCVDKTGTITENRMSVMDVAGPAERHEIIKYGIMASQKKPFDPMEEAFIQEGKNYFSPGSLYAGYDLVKEFPLKHDTLTVAHIYRAKDDGFIAALKGAPEDVIELCGMKDGGKYLKEASALAKKGLRVIAVAKAAFDSRLPEHRRDIGFEFLGLVGLADPVREGISESVKSAYAAGIRIIMITGDHPETALDVAGQIGLGTAGVLVGDEFEAMSAAEKRESIREYNVFSRVSPAQKLLIVEELKRMGEVVAMTGDGVNDAPALKAAHIGISMGLRGTDVAREASSIVLLDDNFNSIVGGVRIGRRIYDNLQKAVNYLLAIHVPIAVLATLPVLFGMPLILLPVHIVFLEFIIDPTCTIVFEADEEDRDIMVRAPRRMADRIISLRNLLVPLSQGLATGIIVFLSYWYYLPRLGESEARSFAFVLLICLNIILMFINLAKRDNIVSKLRKNNNQPMLLVLVTTFLVLFLATTVKAVMEVFKFSNLSPVHFSQILIISAAFLVITETAKKYMRSAT